MQISYKSHSNLMQISRISHANLMNISCKSHANLMHISCKSLTNLRQMSVKYQENLWQISWESLTNLRYLRQISFISQANPWHILGIYQAYISFISTYLMNIQGPCYQVCPILAIFKLIMNPYCTKYPTHFGIISNISYISNTISYASMYDPRTC